MIHINFEKADAIGRSINALTDETDSILSIAKSIDTSAFKYSSGVSSDNQEMCSKISKTLEKIGDFYTSYTKSVQAYKDAYEEAEKKVREKIETPTVKTEEKETPKVDTNNTDTTQKVEVAEEKDKNTTETPTVTKASSITQKLEEAKKNLQQFERTKVETPVVESGVAVATLSKDKEEELEATVNFYFNYPSEAKTVNEIKQDTLRDLLTANGAELVGNNTYKMKIDGKTYSYNVATHAISIDGDNSRESNSPLKCKFFARSDVSYEDVKSTITLLAGSGEAENGYKLSDGSSSVEVSKNSLVIIPYGSNNTPNIPTKVGACTRVGDFLVGGDSDIKNSVVGYSLGGQAAYAAVANNKGLYSSMVTVNSAAYSKSDGGVNFINGKYDSFKDVDIYIFESENDDYIKYVGRTIKDLNANGVSKNNIHLYTNNKALSNNVRDKKYISTDNIYEVSSQYANSHIGWENHRGGYGMLNQSGIFGYLSL